MSEVDKKEAEVVTTISLAEICAELGIKPQSARIKLRKKLKDSKGEGFRWVFPLEQKAEIVELLTAKPEKAEKAEAKPTADEADGEDGEEDDE